MTTNYKKLAAIIISIVLLLSCEKVIDMNIGEQEPKLVLISYLSPDSIIEVHLSKSIHILDEDSITYIRNAEVKVYENDVLLDSLIYNPSKNSYRSANKKPSIGKDYRIEASANGYKKVSAESIIPVPVNIASVDTFFKKESYVNPNNSMIRFLNGSFVIKLSFNDQSSENNYYIISIMNESFDTATKYNYYKDHNYKYNFNIKSRLIEYSSWSAFLDFFVVNGDDGLGAEEESNYLNATQIAFSDKAFNGKNVSFELEVGNEVYSDSINLIISLTSINEDYFKYISSDALYKDAEGPFTEKVQMYNNIKGGLGIVFGSSDVTKMISRKKNATDSIYIPIKE